MNQKKFSFKHKCDLSGIDSQRHIPRVSPYANPIRKWCSRFKNYTTISPTHYQSRIFLRSSAAIFKETKRHLGTPTYRNVIHPFSKFTQVAHFITCLCWFMGFTTDPVMGIFLIKHMTVEAESVSIFVATYQIILFVHILVQFYTGYIIDQTREIVLEPKKISKRYLRTYFVVDLIPALAFAVSQLFGTYISKTWQLPIFQICYIRIFRIKTALDYLEEILINLSVPSSVRSAMFLTILGVWCVHWWACALAALPLFCEFIGIPLGRSWLDHTHFNYDFFDTDHKYVSSHDKLVKLKPNGTLIQLYLHHVVIVSHHFYGVGKGLYVTEDPSEMLLLTIMLMTGMCFYLYFSSEVLRLFGVTDICESKYDNLYTQINKYMATMKFSRALKKRINNYYDYKFNKKFFSEEKILSGLSDHLRMEVLLYSCKNLVARVEAFQGLSKAAVGNILINFEQEIFLRNDTVFTGEKYDGRVYFILYGTVALYSFDKEFAHFEDGVHFGDIIKYVPGISYEGLEVVAAETSEIYYLSEEKLKFCCATYPEIGAKLRVLAQQRSRLVSESARYMHGLRTTIIGELKGARILEQRLPRMIFRE